MEHRIYTPLLNLPANTAGRDFVCGDLHGCYDDFQTILHTINFDKANDRMIFVGDLVDRGPDSMKCAEMLYEPWAFSVRGNHEQMCIDSILHNDERMVELWVYNGGMWFTNHEEWQMKDIATKMDELPLIITVGEGENRFNVVHAELTKFSKPDNGWSQRMPVTDQAIDDWDFDGHDEKSMIWGRTIISGDNITAPFDPALRYHDASLSLTYVGHTPLINVVQVERQMYLDLGGVFGLTKNLQSAKIVIADATHKILLQFSTITKEMTTMLMENIVKYHQ